MGAVAAGDYDGGRHGRRDDGERVRDGARQCALGVRVGPEIQIGPEACDSGDLRGRAPMFLPVVARRQAHAHIYVLARGAPDELRGHSEVAVPVRTLALERPQQNVQLLRLELPQEIEEVGRSHEVSSWGQEAVSPTKRPPGTPWTSIASVAVPVRTLALERPQQNVQLLRLELPQEIEEVGRSHEVSSGGQEAVSRTNRPTSSISCGN